MEPSSSFRGTFFTFLWNLLNCFCGTFLHTLCGTLCPFCGTFFYFQRNLKVLTAFCFSTSSFALCGTFLYFLRNLLYFLRNLHLLSAEPSKTLFRNLLYFLRNFLFGVLTAFCSSTSSTVSRGLISVSAKSSTARSRLSRRTSCVKKKKRGRDRATTGGGICMRVPCPPPDQHEQRVAHDTPCTIEIRIICSRHLTPRKTKSAANILRFGPQLRQWLVVHTI